MAGGSDKSLTPSQRAWQWLFLQLSAFREDFRDCGRQADKCGSACSCLVRRGLPLLLLLGAMSVVFSIGRASVVPPEPPTMERFEHLFGNAMQSLDSAQATIGGEWWLGGASLMASLRYGQPYPANAATATTATTGAAARSGLRTGAVAAASASSSSQHGPDDHGFVFLYGCDSEAQATAVLDFLQQDFASHGWHECRSFSSAPQGAETPDTLRCARGASLFTAEEAFVQVHTYQRPASPEDAPLSAFAFVHRRKPRHKEPSFGGWVYGSKIFAAWGHRLPLTSVFPLQFCRMFHSDVPCPARALQVAYGFMGLDETAAEAQCAAFPPAASHDTMHAIVSNSHHLHRAGYPSVYGATRLDECMERLGGGK